MLSQALQTSGSTCTSRFLYREKLIISVIVGVTLENLKDVRLTIFFLIYLNQTYLFFFLKKTYNSRDYH